MIGNPLLLPGEGYQISRSVRLRSSASAYLTRTPGSASSLTTWTWSGWAKRGALSNAVLFAAGPWGGTQNYTWITFSSDQLTFDSITPGPVVVGRKFTTAVFRDPSAWYHIVAVWDTTNATAADRMRLYVNGTRITSFSLSTDPASSAVSLVNTTNLHYLAREGNAGSYFDGYLTEVNFIDGQALTPSSFGEFDAMTGVWKPKKYAGTYGNNGFYLNFSDNSNNTATTIGKDYSGNGNNWTPNNISVTSGTTYDSMLDVPTMWADGGNGRGNYAVFNPLDALKSSSASVSNGNLTASPGTTGKRGPMGTLGVSSGKWYFEVVETNRFSDGFIGVCSVSTTSTDYPGASSDSWSYYGGNGNKYNGGTATSYGSSYVDNDVIGVAVDMDNGKIWFSKNGTWQASGDPSAGTNAAYTNLSGYTVTAVVGDDSTTTGGAPTFNANFGQRPFTYTPPSGFKALHTGNLPEPTIKKGNQYFDATVWQGNSSTQNIINSGAMQPDLVWVKDRSTVNIENHWLADSVRGATKHLSSNLTDAEYTFSTAITGFNSNGFAVGADGKVNRSADSYVGWQWKKGATPGFDIVTYTGTGVGRTIAHSLGVAPAMMIVKARSSAVNWRVFHQYWGGDRYLELNTTLASTNNGSVPWNSFVPTSSLFGVGTDSATNANGVTYVNYLFAPVAGFSAFGAYTGNGSADGPFVFCGFRPKFVMVKRTDVAGEGWYIRDTGRNAYNAADLNLSAESSGGEASGSGIDILSNGFKARASGSAFNASGGTYVYAAFAENPLKYSLAR